MARWKNSLTATTASEIAEAALVLPLMFTLLLGIFYVGRAYNIYAAMNHAAREGARAAASSTCATCATPNQPLPADQVATNYVAPVLSASGIDNSRVTSAVTPNFCKCGLGGCQPVQCDPLGTGAVPSVCVQYNVDLGLQNYSPVTCGTAVSFQYPFHLPLPFAPSSLQTVTITTQAQARAEQ
ncbi:MAG: pilus assembly protein [Acidobacteriia bacterium]|nr:pilus assembly protein [Terriglobia bacterium]